MLRTAISTLAAIRRSSCATPRRYKLYLRILKNPGPRIAMVESLERGEVELLADGFPRSGNTYLTWLIKRVFPKLAFAHHLHNAAALELAWTHRLPTYTPFRSPEESVSSLILKNTNTSTNFYRFDFMRSVHRDPGILSEIYMKDYLYYHRALLRHSHMATLLPSEFLFREPHIVLRSIAQSTGAPCQLISADYCKRLTNGYFRTKKMQTEKKSALAGGTPSEEKVQAKQEIIEQHIRTNAHFEECTDIYQSLVEKSNLNK